MTTSAALLRRLGLAPSPSVTGETFSKSDSSHWDAKDPSPYPVVFQNVQYTSATDALDAYIRDFDGKSTTDTGGATGAMSGRGKKLEELLMSPERTDFAERSMVVQQLVNESYEKLNLVSPSPSSSQHSLPGAGEQSSQWNLHHHHKQQQQQQQPPSSLPSSRALHATNQLPSCGLVQATPHSHTQHTYSHKMSANQPQKLLSTPPLSDNGRVMNGGRAPPSWIQDAECSDSDGSSIISGHMMLQKRVRGGQPQCVSTPKRTPAVTRLGLDTSGSTAGPSLNVSDLAVPCQRKQPMTTDSIVSRSRPLSHDASCRSRSYSAAARVRDHLEDCKSTETQNIQGGGDGVLEQPQSSDLEKEKYQQYMLSLLKDIEQSSSSIVTAVAELDPSKMTRDLSGSVSPQMTSTANRSVHFWDERGGLNEETVPTTHVHSDEGLLSSIPTANATDSSDGFGYLERVQRLISSTPPPQEGETVSPEKEAHSPATDITVETERSWEKLPPLRSPKQMGERCNEEDHTDVTADLIMEECLSIVSQHDMLEGDEVGLTGGSQPGGMEALKNMLFSIQRYSHDTDTQGDEGSDVNVNTRFNYESESLPHAATASPQLSSMRCHSTSSQASVTTPSSSSSNLPVPPRPIAPVSSTGSTSSNSTGTHSNTPSLDKAMEHLSRLKSLVSNQTSNHSSSSPKAK